MAVVFYLCIIAGLCFSSANGQVIGGRTKHNPASPDIVDAAKFAVTDYNLKATNPYKVKFIKVTSAQSQVVAWEKFYLHVEVGTTNCTNNGTVEDVDSDSCAVNQVLTCYFEVYYRPLKSHTEVRKSSCS
ncbi:cystatin-like [Hyperolius riggenbachi]|uniref:cystatin-like n=1 Tax=Hyperolius riggenbachi TaxID=752182 RepID=UPI0035A298C2